MVRASHLVLFLVVSTGLMVPSYSQTPGKAKLTVDNVSLSPSGDGFYNAGVGLTFQRPSAPQQSINFTFNFQHIKTLGEVYDKVRPEIDHLADELKNADIDIEILPR
jgi:hypothetical protein